jgi:hypothetical protein
LVDSSEFHRIRLVATCITFCIASMGVKDGEAGAFADTILLELESLAVRAT